MDLLQLLIDLLLPVIPENYKTLAQSWGLYGPVGGLMAFAAAVTLLAGLFWLGMILSFGKIIEENEYARKSFIFIALALGFIGAWYGAGTMFYLMSNAAYLVGIIITAIVLVSIVRALWGGWHAAGATNVEAYKQYLEAKRGTLSTYATLIADLKANGLSDKEIENLFKKEGIWKRFVKTLGGDESAARKFIESIHNIHKGDKGREITILDEKEINELVTEVVRELLSGKSLNEIKEDLMKKRKLTEGGAEYIINLALQRLREIQRK